jgi:hypothetical protein
MVLQVLPNRRSLSILVGLTAAVVAAGCFAQSTSAAMVASDNASSYTGAVGTTGNTNGGTGFGPWQVTITNSNNPPYVDTYLDTSSKPISTNKNSWGVYANTPQAGPPAVIPSVDLTRPFLTAGGLSGGKLDAGQTLSIAMESDGAGGNSPETGASIGFSLQSSAPIDQFTFEYDATAGYDNMSIIDGSNSGKEYESPVSLGFSSYIGKGMTVDFTLVTASTYDLSVTPVGGTTVSVITNGTLPGGQLNQIELFDQNTSGNGYFNSLSISAVPEPASLGLMAIGGLALLLVGRRKTA